MTDEEIENYNKNIDIRCPSCGSKNVSIRRAKYNEYIYGCQDCDNKRICDEKYLQYTIDYWDEYAKKVWARRGENE
jgi:transcription elongation factor Elf1